ncbi:MAG: hypothetical protein CL931_11400 [Deltaproteobacteria bacterium]|nr:hypothetical protein [Deltaproteobacteria bacterium]
MLLGEHDQVGLELGVRGERRMLERPVVGEFEPRDAGKDRAFFGVDPGRSPDWLDRPLLRLASEGDERERREKPVQQERGVRGGTEPSPESPSWRGSRASRFALRLSC